MPANEGIEQQEGFKKVHFIRILKCLVVTLRLSLGRGEGVLKVGYVGLQKPFCQVNFTACPENLAPHLVGINLVSDLWVPIHVNLIVDPGVGDEKVV